jgi:hypothetical protein
MEYGAIVQRAWTVTWKYRVLWFFGLIAAFTLPTNQVTTWMQDDPEAVAQALMRAVELPQLIVTYGVIILLVVVIQIAVHVAGNAALIDQVNGIQQATAPSWGSAWTAIKRYFPRLFAIDIALTIPGVVLPLAVLSPMLVPALRSVFGPGGVPDIQSRVLPTAGAFCCLALPVALVVAVIRALAPLVCVVDDRSALASIEGAVRLLRRNLGKVIAMGAITIGLALGVGLVLAIPVFLWSVLAAGLTAAAAEPGTLPSAPGQVCCAGLFWVLNLVATGLLAVFSKTCWTVWYRQVTGIEPGCQQAS